MMMNWTDFGEGAVGAVIGSIMTALGMGYRLKNVEEDCRDLRKEMLVIVKEIKLDNSITREDIKKLIAKTASRRGSD